MSESHRIQLGLGCLAMFAALIGSAGCQAPKASDLKPSKLFSLDSSWPWGGDGPEEGTPVRLVGTWTDTVFNQPGQKPQRGFGGRLLFYEKNNDKPILVDGQLVVYAFDESGRDPTDNKPTRRYVFPPDQMPSHMSMCEMGTSYSFWLPWDEAGGPRTEVSLICRFEPMGGAVITSEQTKHLLPGAIPLHSATASRQPPQLPEGVPSRPAQLTLESLRNSARPDGGAQLALYESPVDPPAAVTPAKVETTTVVPERRMGVTSITLPDSFNLRAAANQTIVAPANQRATPIVPPSQPQTIQTQPTTPTKPPAANTGLNAATMRPATSARQTAPAMQPPSGVGFGSRQLARPQLITPQFMTVQPAPATMSGTDVSYPSPAAPQPMAAPQPAVR
ncbi:MAG: hypothetical protein WD738_09595 [Pirellulales bacterium]